MNAKFVRSAAAVVSAGAMFLSLGGVAHAGKPSGGGTTPGSSLSVVLLNSADGVPNWGESITFNVQTSVDRKWVQLDCYQNSTMVYTFSAGFFPDYPWSTTYILRSNSWTGGAASCKARLYTTKDGSRTTTLATLDFPVYA